MRKALNNNWIKSIIINAVILLAIMVCTHISYETSDDYVIAARIAAGYPYVGFVNYYLCKLLIGLQAILPEINAFVIFQIACSYFALVVFLKLIMDMDERRMLTLVATALIAVFAFDLYASLQFSKTAAVLMLVGMMTLVDAVIHKRNFGYYLLGLILCAFGYWLRADAALVALGFAGLFFLLWIISRFKTLKSEGYLEKQRIVFFIAALVCLIACVGSGSLSSRMNNSTEELQYANEYNVYRSNAVDFKAYESYEGHEKEYAQIGIDENDLYLIDKWYFDYDGAASLDKLKEIDAVKKEVRKGSDSSRSIVGATKSFIRSTASSILKLDRTGIHLVLIGGLAVALMFVLKPKNWIYIILLGCFAAAAYIALFYMQRPAYRAFFIADAGACLWLLYYACYKTGDKVPVLRTLVPEAIILLLALVMIIPMYNKAEAIYTTNAGRVQSEEMQSYFSENSDKLFVVATKEKKQSADYLTPLLAPDTDNYNVVGTGSWGSCSPYMLDILERNGVENPIADIVDNANAYYVGNANIDRLTSYYNKWHVRDGAEIEFVKVDELDGYNIWSIRSK